jgi:hypothetical protein
MNKILSLFGVHRTGMILTVASQVLKTFEQEFAKDGEAKAAALDAFLDVLQQHKAQTQAAVAANPAPALPAP